MVNHVLASHFLKEISILDKCGLKELLRKLLRFGFGAGPYNFPWSNPLLLVRDWKDSDWSRVLDHSVRILIGVE